jgi:hypothetical protein
VPPINLEFDSLEGLPDPLKSVLVERDGKYVLEGETPDEVKNLRAAHEGEKAKTKKLTEDLKKQAEQYKDLDPEKARDALKRLEDLEDQKLLDAGKMDELFEKRLTAAREAWEREKQSLVRDRDKWQGEHSTLKSKYEREAIDGAMRTAMAPLVKPEHHDDVANRLRPFWQFAEDGQMVPMRNGEMLWGKNPTQPISMSEQVEALIKDVPVFGLPSSGGGAGNMAGTSFSRNGGSIVLPREQAKDARVYREARERAEKTGANLVDELGNRLA